MIKLPVYEALISNSEDGIVCMSLVDYPATEVNWVAFNKQEEALKFAVTNEEEHILCGVVMVADTPIYRISPDGYEYYIKYSKETIKLMAEKWLQDSTHNKVDLMHNGNILEEGSASLVELFIKDESKGINPNYFDVPDGSLLCTYKIHNEVLWDMCKNGTFQGFSLEGYFTVQETNEYFSKQSKTSFMKSLKEKLRSLLMEFSNIMTDKGNLFYEGDELTVNSTVQDKDGEPIEDGEYATDEKIYVIENSIVKEVKDANEPTVEEETPIDEPKDEETTEEVVEDEPIEEPKEEPTVEEPTEEDEVVEEEPAVDEEVVEEPIEETPSEVDVLKTEIENLKKQIEEILNKLNEPAVTPIVEEFASVQKESAFDSKLNKAMKIASKLK